MYPPLQFRLLGPFEVWAGGRRLKLGGPKQRALLAALLLDANRVVASDRLIEAVWGEEPPRRPATALQTRISQLRKLLEPPRQDGGGHRVLLTHPAGYLFRVDPDSLDVHRFEQLAGQGHAALRGGKPKLAGWRLREALALFRGPPLADFTYESFASAEIGRLEELRLTALEDRVQADLEVGAHEGLIGELEALVAEHPLSERLRAQLMLALYRAGRQAEALELYRRTRRELVEELGVEPGPELQRLERSILNQSASLEVQTSPRPAEPNLPLPPNPLIGRRRELAELEALILRQDVRLVTLTGPGGIGKSRLALELARGLADEFADGVVFVSLAPIRDPSLVLNAIFDALPLKKADRRHLPETLGRYLHEHELLLVVDNLEHLTAAAVEVGSLLAAAPRLTVIATSRAPLRVAAEHEYEVLPLSLPDRTAEVGVEELREHDAVELFVARAQAARAGFALTSSNAAAVAEICIRLDGLPLALELAAARIKLLSPQAMLDHLEHPLGLLTGGARDLPERQQTIRATLEWSYRLIGRRPRELMARLGVFAGSFTLEAAIALTGFTEPDILEPLAALLDNSLLRREEDRTGGARYQMLATIREFALERLERSGQAEPCRRRHAEHYLELAERAEPELRRRDQLLWFERLETEFDNLRAAFDWSLVTGEAEIALRLAGAMQRVFYVRGRLNEGRRWLEEALAHGGEQPLEHRAKALTAAANVACFQGDLLRARAFAEDHVALARGSGDARDLADALTTLGNVASTEGDYEAATAAYEQALALARQASDDWLTGQVLLALGSEALLQDDYGRAEELCTEARELLCEVGDETGAAVALQNLGLAALLRGDESESRALLEECLADARALGHLRVLATCLEATASIAAREDSRRAVEMMAAADHARRESGARVTAVEQGLRDGTLALVRGRLDERAFRGAWRRGSSAGIEEAAAAALSGSPVGAGKERSGS